MSFTNVDVKNGLFSMKKGKAPGHDGMSASFYQFYWDIVHEDISAMVLNCVNEGRFLKKFNFMFITLIPKMTNPTEITQFRPIALCNRTANLIAKVLAERLKTVLVTIVSESQSAFVPNRLITYNILLAYELHHFIKLRKTWRKGFMSIKLDMHKTYDRIEWSFEVTTHGIYLGLPSIIGSSKKEVFSSLVGRIKSRIEDWKPSLLSKAGKAVFITSVLQSIPTFDMQCFKLPLTICHEINSCIANYWWGSTKNNRKIHWVVFDKFCKAKSEGGLSCRYTHTFNISLLSKQTWKIATDPSSQIALTYKAKYFPNDNFWNSKLGPSPSLTWRSLITARDLLEKGAKWSVGNERTIQ
ncbi:hypothetical protein LIER_08523 [Lithospermum erythrorhizon]|uniref:Reverse transcriptase domain-containing protein n=1 Tax=Lithospermum erythrorhizon TaxID=34254 RepID=A0AAV3PD33_LITER